MDPRATLTPHFGERAAPTLHFIDLRDGADALQDVLDNAVAAERTG